MIKFEKDDSNKKHAIMFRLDEEDYQKLLSIIGDYPVARASKMIVKDYLDSIVIE